MIINKLLTLIEDVKPNAFSTATKLQWLNTCEAEIFTEVMLKDPADYVPYTDTVTDLAKELLAPIPFDRLYEYYLEAQIDFANGEYDRYANTMQLYNETRDAYAAWYGNNHDLREGEEENG